jgi:thymidylate synthase
MRYFQTVLEALKEVERDLIEMGIDNWPKSMQNVRTEDDPLFQTKELVGYSFRVHNPSERESLRAVAEFHNIPESVVESYCQDEITDRLGFKATNPGHSWVHRAEVWKPFINAEGKFDYTYSERLVNTVRFARELLQNDPGTRQAILQVFEPTDVIFGGGKRRIPCSMYYQFLNRPRDFHVLYTMRSCDIYTHFGFDVTLAIMLAKRMKDSLEGAEKKPIVFTMFIGSLHAYRKDYEPRGVF